MNAKLTICCGIVYKIRAGSSVFADGTVTLPDEKTFYRWYHGRECIGKNVFFE